MDNPEDVAGRPDDGEEPAKPKPKPPPEGSPEAALIKKVEALEVEVIDKSKVPVEFKHPSNKIGRPTKYRENMPQRVMDYIKERLAMGMLPTRDALASSFLIDTVTLWDWEKKKPDFSNALKVLKTIQADMLIHKGLTKKWDPFFVQFLLKNNHGYRDTVQVDARVSTGDQVFLLNGQEIIF